MLPIAHGVAWGSQRGDHTTFPLHSGPGCTPCGGLVNVRHHVSERCGHGVSTGSACLAWQTTHLHHQHMGVVPIINREAQNSKFLIQTPKNFGWPRVALVVCIATTVT